MKPREYQIKAVNDCRESLKQGNRSVALALSVGAGKSLIARMILENAKGKIGFFTFRNILIEQIKPHLDKLNKDITYGTLQKHGKVPTDLYDLVIVDENWGSTSKLKNNINARYMITLTGTPVDSNGYKIPTYDAIVDGVQLPDLIKQGYAKKIKYMSMPKVSTNKLKVQGGDFNKKQSFELMDKASVHSDIVGTYKKFASDRKVVVFAVNTEHCENLKNEFLKANVKADSMHSKKNNDKVLNNLESGVIDVLVSVDMVTVGVDIPSINCIIFARPMKSIPLFIQCIGRATRINPKSPNDDALILDCADVYNRTEHNPMSRLDFNKTKSDDKLKKCVCGKVMKLVSRDIKDINEFEYLVSSKYICDCGLEEIEENIKLKAIIDTTCQSCQYDLLEVEVEMIKTNDSIEFTKVCPSCGEKSIRREILLNDKELVEIKEEQAKIGKTWEDVKLLLKIECKKCGYKWQYSDRLMEHLKNKNMTAEESIKAINEISKKGHKISRLMFV